MTSALEEQADEGHGGQDVGDAQGGVHGASVCGALVEAIKHLLFIQVNTWGIEGNKKPAEAG